jgi:superfamily I DNA/RNA helicase
MDKRIILAVAGSGKTTYIINQLNENTRSLIVTYTINNFENLRTGIINKFGYIPSNISLLRYFPFLYTFCYKPFLSYKLKTNGINFGLNPNKYAKQNKRDYYFDKFDRLYSNRIAKLLDGCNVIKDVNNRLSKYFDNLFIDEVQDLAGNDFNFLLNITKSNINSLLVGDFYQHTFDTSRDGNVNSSLHNDYNAYKDRFKKAGIFIDNTTLNKSYRCSPNVTDFITKNLGINIESHRKDNTTINFTTDTKNSDEIFSKNNVVKLFLKEHYNYSCYSRNWGDCKGEDKYIDICVVMNKDTYKLFEKNKLIELKPQTKNKLYVAMTRAKNNIFIISEELYKKYKKI